MTNLLIALVLFGAVSNGEGLIGIRVSQDGYVSKVHLHSPAAGLIYEGDTVLEADGVKGLAGIDGPCGTYSHLTIRRGKEIKTFAIIRVPKQEIKD